MARRKRATKRVVLPDPKFKDRLVTRFINSLMIQGKKSLAERVFYGAMDIIEEKMKEVIAVRNRAHPFEMNLYYSL